MTGSVGELTHSRYTVAAPFDAVDQVVDALVSERFLVVMDGGRFVGMLTPSDVVERPHKLVVDCLTPKPSVDCRAERASALSIMNSCLLPVLAVFDGEAFRGVVTFGDLAFALQADHANLENHLEKLERFDLTTLVAAGVAHDLRNVLHGLSWHLLECQPEIQGQPQPVAVREQTVAWMNRAQSLTKQLLSFCLGGEPTAGATETAAVIEQNVSFFLCGAPVRPEFRFDANLGQLEMSSRAFSRVIGNIISNARQAMAGGGVLNVTAENSEVAAQRHPDDPAQKSYVRIRIADSGPGIDEQHLERVFEPGFTTKPEGTGLGLAIVKSIVQQHRGFISVTSSPGSGAVFELLLPMKDGPKLELCGK